MYLKRHLMVVILFLSLLTSLFFQAQVSAQTSVSTQTSSEEIGESLPKEMKEFVDSHIEWAIELGDKVEAEHGSKPPTESVLGESGVESAWGESNFCLTYNNDFGIGGVDNPMYFTSHYESWVYYYNLISTREGYVENGSLTATNTYDYIAALVAGGYCSDDGYLQCVVSASERIKPYVQAKEAEVRAEKARSEKVQEQMDRISAGIARARILAHIGSLAKDRRVPK